MRNDTFLCRFQQPGRAGNGCEVSENDGCERIIVVIVDTEHPMNQTYEPHELPGEMCTTLDDVFPRGWLLVFTHPEGQTAEGVPRERIVFTAMMQEDCAFMKWYYSTDVEGQWHFGSVMEAGGQDEETVTYEHKRMDKEKQPFDMPQQLADELSEVLPRGWMLFYSYPAEVMADGSMWERITAIGCLPERSVIRAWAGMVMRQLNWKIYERTEDDAEAGGGNSSGTRT